MSWLIARLNENSTRAAFIFLCGHFANLLSNAAPITPREIGSILLMAIVVALTPDKNDAPEPPPVDPPPVAP